MTTNYFNVEKRDKPVFGDFLVKENYEGIKHLIEFNTSVLKELPEFKNKTKKELQDICSIAAKAIYRFSETIT
mgnify:CR=1 FL=1|tara:strand:+ start:264 stop:482 length:219 start_codon:yes stop_codon:yes gene_type:complete